MANIFNISTHSSNSQLYPNLKVADELSQIADNFLSGKGQALNGTNGLELITAGGKYFFGIHKTQQNNLDYRSVKAHLFERLNLPTDTKIIQVIGDSGRFSESGTNFAKTFLSDQLKKGLVLWGYTGKANQEKTTCDVNQTVNNWLESEPKRFEQALANVVDHHSVQAIREWGCSIPEKNKHFYLVYGNAYFGDDVHSSDSLTDMGICLEGGIQSFRQIVNFLSRCLRIVGIYNLRGENNPDSYNEESKQYLTYFSAGEFLDSLQQEVKSKQEISSEDIEAFKDNYLNPKEGNKRFLFNPSRKDASTKEGLWQSAWEQFKKEKLWQKLHLCHFTKVEDQKNHSLSERFSISKYIVNTVFSSFQDSPKRYIITGGPGVGKTTIINYLEKLGESIISEAARDVISRELAKGISEPWTKLGFREKIVSLQEERQSIAITMKANRVFFDRSPIDTLTYCLLFKFAPTLELINAVQKIVKEKFYNTTVFFIENLGFCNKDDVRTENQDESILIQEQMRENYKILGFKIVSIPPDTVEKRVNKILTLCSSITD